MFHVKHFARRSPDMAAQPASSAHGIELFPVARFLKLPGTNGNLRLKNLTGWVIWTMVTIYRAHGPKVVIFVDDHEPAHVHVFGDGQAKINLCGRNDEPELIRADAMTRTDVRRAMKILTEHKRLFLAQWKEIHG